MPVLDISELLPPELSLFFDFALGDLLELPPDLSQWKL
jgi:hypothetical protein